MHKDEAKQFVMNWPPGMLKRLCASAILEREVREKVFRKKNKLGSRQTQEESPALGLAVARDSTPLRKYVSLNWVRSI
jgi:hypothetical protein